MKTLTLGDKSYELDLPDFTATGHYRRSMAFICPECLSQWALLRGQACKRFDLFAVPCDKCSPSQLHEVPGSLIDKWTGFGGGIDPEMLDALPLELLKRELDLTLKAYYEQDTGN